MIYISGKYQCIYFENDNGNYHRIDGPAIINVNYQVWYIEGIAYTETEFYEKTKISKYSQKSIFSFLSTICSGFLG